MPPTNYPLYNGRFPDYYELLGVRSTANEKDIKTAYHKSQLENHPDKAGDSPAQNEKSAAINSAKEVLLDRNPAVRYQYNQHLAEAKAKTARLATQATSRATATSANRPTPRYFPFPASHPFSPPQQNPFANRQQHSTFRSSAFTSGEGFGPERQQARPPDFAPESSSPFEFCPEIPRPPDNRPLWCPRCRTPWCTAARCGFTWDFEGLPCDFKAYGGHEEKKKEKKEGA